MVDYINNTTAAIDGIYGTPSVAEVQKAFREEARLALTECPEKLTLRIAQNVHDCYPLPLTEERLLAVLNSKAKASMVEHIRAGRPGWERLKTELACVFFQGTLDMAAYADAVKPMLESNEKLPSAVKKEKFFALATPFAFIDIDQCHDEGAEQFDPLVVFGQVQNEAPAGEVVFAQSTARKGLRLVVRRNDTESLQQIQQRYGTYARREVDILLDYTRRSFLTTMQDVFYLDTQALCAPFSREDAMKWAKLDKVEAPAKTDFPTTEPTEVKPLQTFTPWTSVAQVVDEMLGGEVGEGSRHNRYMRILGYMRHVCVTPAELVAACGYDDLPLDERMRCAEDVCSKQPSRETPKILTEAIEVVKAQKAVEEEQASGYVRGTAEPQLPNKLPKVLSILTKKVHPILYPSVIRSAFAAFGTHLSGVRVRYENGVENELPIIHLCVAPQGSGKSSIIAPSDVILRDIICKDNENRSREAAWKAAKRMGEMIDRPQDLAVQILSSDCTAAAFNQKLADASGKYLYMRMDELEGLKKMAGSVDRATEILRLAFDAATYGQERVGADSVTTRCTLRLNLVASTTPVTAQKFFKGSTLDGTLTRIGLSTINNPDNVRWKYGTYDLRYADELAPYVERLKSANGLITCPQAEEHIRALMESAEDRLAVNGQDHLAAYVYRASIIAYREAIILYLATGKWTREIADYMAWSLDYQLWVMDKVFGRQIRLAHEEAQAAERMVPVVQNLLTAMPDEFGVDDLKRHFISVGKKVTSVSSYLRQQVHRGNLTRTLHGYCKTERFRQRYEGMV